MALFKKKTAEEKQTAMDAKFAKAEKALERDQKANDKVREKFDESTMNHKLTLMKVGVDVRDALGIVMRNQSAKELMTGSTQEYMVAMPDALMIYTIGVGGIKDMVTPVKNTVTVPYNSIHNIEAGGGFKSSVKVSTSTDTHEFEVLTFGPTFVEIINQKRV